MASESQCPPNRTLFQAFEWFCPSDHQHWRRLKTALPHLKHIGIDNIWIPPACKAGHSHSNGYDIYDLWDLGEFDQKGSKRTKWGTKHELVEFANAAHEQDVGIFFDAVLGHKAGANYPEKCNAVQVSPTDRTRPVANPEEIEAWVGFDFGGRGDRYSSMKYNRNHFNGVDYDFRKKEKGIFKLLGDDQTKDWAPDVDKENVNFDYLLCANLDLSRSDVREDIFQWTEWIIKELKLKGFRLDSAKHTSRSFIKQLLDRMGPGVEMIAEYTSHHVHILRDFVDELDRRVFVTDFALHGNFVRLSKAKTGDLRMIMENTLVKIRPENAATFVTNHDTQYRDQDFDTVVAPFFIPIAYALILLSGVCGFPCVFYGDLYGILGPNGANPPSCDGNLAKLVMTRKLFAYGQTRFYASGPQCVGFTRTGHAARSSGNGLAVTMSTGTTAETVSMFVGTQHASERWTNILKTVEEGQRTSITIDGKGLGRFPTRPRGVTIWVNSTAQYREQLDRLDFDDNFYQD